MLNTKLTISDATCVTAGVAITCPLCSAEVRENQQHRCSFAGGKIISSCTEPMGKDDGLPKGEPC